MGLLSGIKSYVKPPTETPAAPPPSSGNGGSLSPAHRHAHNASSRASIAHSTSSSPRSEYPEFENLKYDVLGNFIMAKALREGMIQNGHCEREGLFIRKARDDYYALPALHNEDRTPLLHAIKELNPLSFMTAKNVIIEAYLSNNMDATEVPLEGGQSVQLIATFEDLSRARKHQFAAFIMEESCLVVWDDNPLNLCDRALDIVKKMTQTVLAESELRRAPLDEKKNMSAQVVEVDPESGELPTQERKTVLLNTTYVALTLVLIVTVLGAGARELAIEVAVDGKFIRVAFLLLTPIQIFFTLFFAQVIVGCISQIIGPTRQMRTNSRFYSNNKSPRLKTNSLPHVTIQCPVYKEGLGAVIMPTIQSVKQAISTYELQGGSANILIHDDGLQSIPEKDRLNRIDFYADNSVGWTARPNHNAILLDGRKFVKKGKFKKASNMNYGLMLSCEVEKILAEVNRHEKWTQDDEAAAYNKALMEVAKKFPDAWMDGNIRVGDYILLIDSDTRVPVDCLLDAVSEMEQSPEVGIMQFNSGVMQVQHDFFENGITFFTNLIYSAIRYTVSNGDVAPFVGHNAILRWNAIQQVSYQDEDGYDKFWSESHVSEDFDMSLRLQCNHYIIRLANWAQPRPDGLNGEFQEGVSLTVYDELARWEKYAFGCNELLFHPLIQWPYRGPFTPLFRKFLFSNIRFTSKITIISYIGTYYAIGAAWIMTLANYFAMGWYNGYLDKYYIDSWKVWFSIVLVFNGLGNFGLAAMRYRDEDHSGMSSGSKAKGFIGHLAENFKWTFMFAIFLGGLSLHVSSALLAHMFGYNMTWGSTTKEVTETSFWQEVPRIFKAFKYSMIFSVSCIALMIVLGTGLGGLLPEDWLIQDFVAILPMATVAISHLLLPIVLNPGLMRFSY